MSGPWERAQEDLHDLPARSGLFCLVSGCLFLLFLSLFNKIPSYFDQRREWKRKEGDGYQEE